MQGEMMIGTGNVPVKSSTAAQLLLAAVPKTFKPLSLLNTPTMYCVESKAPVGPFSINNRKRYCFELGAAPGPIYSYRISPPIIWVANVSENKKISRQEKRIFFIIGMVVDKDSIKATQKPPALQSRRLYKLIDNT